MCHYAFGNADGSAKTFPATYDGNGNVIYPAVDIMKIDHQFAKGNNLPDGKNMDNLDNTVTCASCHTERTHPNTGTAPDPSNTHAGFPAFHFEKIDCRVCHIPALNGPQQWVLADFTVGPYRIFERNQVTENSNGVNYKPLYMWRTVEHSGKVIIEPVVTTSVAIWVDGDSSKSTYQRVAKSAAEARRTALGFNANGVAVWPLNRSQNGDTSLIVNTTEEITDMVSRVKSAAGGTITPVNDTQ